ncbi:MAG: elongation factor P [Proteobacteria bacterium]|nr:elongation factor P [Pseudomonadota bacterium]MBU1612483.1 elongation factor P [Pseudomonadota bacterium]
MFSTKDFRTGLKIEQDGKPWEIIEFQHFKPGKGGAMVRTKLKNMLTGQVVDKTYRSGEKVGKPDISVQEMQFVYRDGTDLVMMDLESYEQLYVPEDKLSSQICYVKEGDTVKTLLYNGVPIDLDLPASVVMEVTETEPGVQGDRVSGATKPAILETGIKVNVPLFINQGDMVKVDTRSGEYLGRE